MKTYFYSVWTPLFMSIVLGKHCTLLHDSHSTKIRLGCYCYQNVWLKLYGQQLSACSQTHDTSYSMACLQTFLICTGMGLFMQIAPLFNLSGSGQPKDMAMS